MEVLPGEMTKEIAKENDRGCPEHCVQCPVISGVPFYHYSKFRELRIVVKKTPRTDRFIP
jgi:hypothetical protein